MANFDYYIFVDYSENLLGYLIADTKEIPNILPKIRRLKHYREAGDKKSYIRNVKATFKREQLIDLFFKGKIRETRENLEIFSDIAEFIAKHSNLMIFISVDNKQYNNFERLVKIIDGESTKIVKESELKPGTMEHKLSLVLDNWLNIERLKK